MPKPSFDDFTCMLDQAVNRIPLRFCRELTGGFNVLKEKKREGAYYVLGEYVEESHLGSFVVFYYGSFVELLKNEPLEIWEAEIMDTVLHEMQHHLESQAGTDDLSRKEIEELAEALHQE